MRKITAANVAPATAWEALDIDRISDATIRLHWTDQPYRWHVNDGADVARFSKLDRAAHRVGLARPFGRWPRRGHWGGRPSFFLAEGIASSLANGANSRYDTVAISAGLRFAFSFCQIESSSIAKISGTVRPGSLKAISPEINPAKTKE